MLAQGKHQDLVIKYEDKNGCKKWKGSKHLRGSEYEPYFFQSMVIKPVAPMLSFCAAFLQHPKFFKKKGVRIYKTTIAIEPESCVFQPESADV